MGISTLGLSFGFGEMWAGQRLKTYSIASPTTSTEKDFDFLIGKWKIKNRKLNARLNNCTEWTEFEATGEMQKILNGIGNTDNFLATIEGKPFEGRTLRLFNPKTKLWSVHWADSIAGVLDVPVIGSFEGNIGKFYTKDVFNEKEIIVMFQWDKTNSDKPVWSQAFSPDNGKTWEWNWYMNFHRNDNLNSNQILKVIELRNYLLKPNSLDKFQHYFQDHFIESQNILNGHTLGQFKVKDVSNRFFWFRGFSDMASRLNFLKSFYDKSTNEMMLDSSQVHLLRPVNYDGDWQADSHGIIRNDFLFERKMIVIDYYFSKQGKLGELIDLFRTEHAKNLLSRRANSTTLWITELSKSKFRHPVIQDSNLLVAITVFYNEEEYREHLNINMIINKISEVVRNKETLILHQF